MVEKGDQCERMDRNAQDERGTGKYVKIVLDSFTTWSQHYPCEIYYNVFQDVTVSIFQVTVSILKYAENILSKLKRTGLQLY